MAKVGICIVLHERSGHVILGRERVRGAEHDLAPPALSVRIRIGGLGGHMQACGQTHTLERLLFLKTLSDDVQHRHALVRPLDSELAFVGQFDIFYIVFHLVSLVTDKTSGDGNVPPPPQGYADNSPLSSGSAPTCTDLAWARRCTRPAGRSGSLNCAFSVVSCKRATFSSRCLGKVYTLIG